MYKKSAKLPTDPLLKLGINDRGKLLNPSQLETIHSQVKETLDHPLKNQSSVKVFLEDLNPVRFGITFFHLLDMGQIPIPLPHGLSDFQRRHLVENHTDSHFLTGAESIGAQFSSEPRSEPYTNTYGCLTSGTTGQSKLCFLSVDGALKLSEEHADSMSIDSGDQIIQSLPLYHSFGLMCFLWTAVVKKASIDFNSGMLGLRMLSRKKLKQGVLHISPAQLRFMLNEKLDQPIAGMRAVSVGGGPVYSEELTALRKKFDPNTRFFVTYGLTEAGPRVSTGIASEGRGFGYIGKTFPSVSARVMDSSGELREEGEGLFYIKTPGLFLNPSPKKLKSGFYCTDDLVKIDPSGDMYFLSRADDLINVGGVSTYPEEIESVTRLIPGVMDCIVFKTSDPVFGEVPALFVEGEVDQTDVRNFLSERLDLTQLPRKITTLKTLPRNSLNKVDRQALINLIETES